MWKALFFVGFCSAAVLASADSCSEGDGTQCAADAGDSNSHMQLNQRIKLLDNSKKAAAKSSAGSQHMHEQAVQKQPQHKYKLTDRRQSSLRFSRFAPLQPRSHAERINMIRYQSLKKAGSRKPPELVKRSAALDAKRRAKKDAIECDWDTEHWCMDDDGTEFCVPSIEGCPVECIEGEHECSDTWMNSTWRWCSASTCPMTCDWENEQKCWMEAPEDCEGDECWGYEFCVQAGAGCPVCCGEGQFKCRDTYEQYAWNWCQDTPCPLSCDWETEQTCYNSQNDTEYCHPSSENCPVHCAPDEDLCTSTPFFKDDPPYQWCTDPEQWPCPPECEAGEEVLCYVHQGTPACWDEDPDNDPEGCWEYTQECHPRRKGCPVQCSEGEIACIGNYASYYYQFCHKGSECTECPHVCAEDEMMCWVEQCQEEYVSNWADKKWDYVCTKQFKEDGETWNSCPVNCCDPTFECTSSYGYDYCVDPEWSTECYDW